MDGKNQTVSPLVYTPREAAQALRISLRTLAERTKEGVFPVVKIGRCTRYDAEMLRQWIRDHQQKKSDNPPDSPLTNRQEPV